MSSNFDSFLNHWVDLILAGRIATGVLERIDDNFVSIHNDRSTAGGQHKSSMFSREEVIDIKPAQKREYTG